MVKPPHVYSYVSALALCFGHHSILEASSLPGGDHGKICGHSEDRTDLRGRDRIPVPFHTGSNTHHCSTLWVILTRWSPLPARSGQQGFTALLGAVPRQRAWQWPLPVSFSCKSWKVQHGHAAVLGHPWWSKGPTFPCNLWSGAAAVAAPVLRRLALTTDENVGFFTNLKIKSLFGFIYWKLLIG